MEQGKKYLFRTEVINQQSNRLHGDVLLLPKFSHTLIINLLLTWVILLITWLLTGSYARKETVLGWLEPSTGVTRIYAKGDGLVQKILVEEGQTVISGQSLMIISDDHHLSSGDALENLLLNEYEKQQQLLIQQLDNHEYLYQQKQEELKKELASNQHSLSLLENQLATLTERHDLAQTLVTRNQTLFKQHFISQNDFDTSRSQELSLRNERQKLLQEKTQVQNNLDKLQIELHSLPEMQANENLQLQASLSDLVQQIAQLNGQRTYVIKAPKTGQITNLQVSVGKRVYAGSSTPLLSLLPENANINARLLLPVRAAGFVEKGQTLDIRYDAFPYQKFGLYKGEVQNISESVLMPGELSNSPLHIEEAVYQIDATLQQPFVQAYGKNFRLKPGMTLNADIRLSERNLLQWLLDPIYSLKGRL